MWWFLFLLAPALGFQLNREPPPPPLGKNTYETRWVNVRLNHFDASNTDTFPMRFFYNRRGSAPNIVIFVGGEWEITPGWVTGGLGYDVAGFTDSSLIYTEHRYYGLTRPTNGTSVSNLRFLTIDQALADLAQFITYVRSDAFENGIHRNARVILIGCSYAGTMATWMRVQYPHLIDVALSDSGPLRAQDDFPEYLRVVGEALEGQGGRACYGTVEQAVDQVTALLATTNGRAQVSQIFNTCAPLSASNLDLATFHWNGLIYSFAALVQYATPGAIPAVCAQLTNTTIHSDPVQRLASYVRQNFPSCIEARYSEVVDMYRNTSFDSSAATGRAWMYQTCVEYGWYQSTSGPNQPFGNGVPLSYFQQMCMDFFSLSFDAARLSYGVSRTNLFFGGPPAIPDRVISVAGRYDPWYPMGPNESHSRPLAPVFFVPDISHCRIIYSIDNSETEAVRDVKVQVLNQINEFIYGPLAASASRAVSSVLLLLVVGLGIL